MKNFKSRISLGDGKCAFEQENKFADIASAHMKRIGRTWKPPSSFYHLRRGGHVAAVKAHLTGHAFGKIDLRRFFEQITRNRIVKRLVPLGYSEQEAIDFAVASTVRRGRKFVLPYGFVQSSLLASLDLDKSALGGRIRALAAAGAVVTVYVDDIIISGSDVGETSAMLDQLREATVLSNYEINESKSIPVGPSMTAFNIEFSRGSMAITTSRLNEFEQEILKRGDSAASIALYSYVRSVSEQQAAQLLVDFPKQLSSVIKKSADAT